MTLSVKVATIEQKPIIERLMQLYQYDFSEIEGTDVNDAGLFYYKYLDLYWTEPGRLPFLIFVDNKIAGFVFVNSHTYLHQKENAKSIAEFFILHKYRRRGIGKKVAFDIFAKFPGKWEVQQTKKNVSAQIFWRNVINEYTDGDFTETLLDDESWQGPVQSFDNGGKPRSSI